MPNPILSALLIIFLSLSGYTAPARQGNTITPSDLINATNTARVAYGLSALTVDPILMGTAQATADMMAINNLHGHIGDVRGRVMAAGYGGGATAWATENWASGPLTIDELMSGPWADASHMIPVVSPNYTHIGAGVAEYNGRVIYIVHAAYTSGGSYTPPTTGTTGGLPLPVPGVSQIIVPVETAEPQADGTIIHEVKSGQSLWAIAIAYHTHIVDVQRLNGMATTDSTVYIGQKLAIPNTANLVAPTPDTPEEQTAVALLNAAGTPTPGGTPENTQEPAPTLSGRRPTRTPMPRFTPTPSSAAAAFIEDPQAPATPGRRFSTNQIVLAGLAAAFGLGLLLVVSGLFGKKTSS